MDIQHAVGYIRFSSAIQEKGTSIRRQRKMITDFCDKRPDLTLHNIYTDEGKSAWNKDKHDERKAFLQMISDRKNELFPQPVYLLVEDASRLSRLDFVEAVAQMKDLLEIGFVVHFLATGKTYTLEGFKKLGDHISFIVDAETHHKASEQKSEHSKRNWSQLREDAIKSGKLISRSCARWVTPVATGTGLPNTEGRNTTFIFNDHAKTVSRVFQMRLANDSMATIAQVLNAENVPTLTGKDKAWNQTTIHGLLNNRAVIGDYIPSKNSKYSDEVIPGYYPPVPGVTLADFQTVQAMREGKGRTSESDNPTNVNMFKGILKCVCGGAIISASVTSERYGYYVCSMYRQGRCSNAEPLTSDPREILDVTRDRPTTRQRGKITNSGRGARGRGVSISRQLVDDALVSGLLYNLPKLLSGSNDDQSQLANLEAEQLSIEQDLTVLEDNMSRMKASDRLLKRYSDLESKLLEKQKEIDSLKSRMLTSVNVETVSHLDLSQREDRIELNLIAKKYISEIRLDLKMKTCDIHLLNGFKFLSYPLDRPDFDGASWVALFLMLNEKEYTFTGNEGLTSGEQGTLIPLPTVTAKPTGQTVTDDREFPDVEPDYPNTDD